MNKTRRYSVWLRALTLGMCSFGVAGVVLTASGQEKEGKEPAEKSESDKGSRGPGGTEGGGGKNHFGPGFTKEEDARLREVLAQVWQDPEVVAAKEKVKLATDDYRGVLEAAVERIDPEVVKLMEKLHEFSRTMALRKEQDGHRRRMFLREGGGGPLGPGLHEFLGRLNEEERQLFMEAREKAEESESVIALREEMRKLDDPGERMRCMMKGRDVLIEEMVKVDARVKELLPRLEPRGERTNGGAGRPPNGGAGGKKKGDEGNGGPERPEGE